ncbi:MAG: MBL fold metallo-hydrolase, partial [Firmicutes bacterium]|nr:MBL fold metallo-hydrolase [Bacillota bacterium]
VKVLIDTGFGRQARQEVQAYVNVDVIISTHFHYDHISGNSSFPQAEIWAHHLDAPALCSEQPFLRLSGLGRVLTPEMFSQRFPNLTKGKPAARELTDGEILDFGGVSLPVVHLPGHTPGHIGFRLSEDGIFFSTDIDLSGFGPWYGTLCSSIPMFIESIHKLKALNPRILVTSHTGVITDQIPARLAAFEDVIEARNRLILNALPVPKSLDELAAERLIYRKPVPPENIFDFFERTMVEKHLEYLLNQQRILLTEDNRYLAVK